MPSPSRDAWTIDGTRFIQPDPISWFGSDDGYNYFGPEQLDWLLHEIDTAEEQGWNVVLMQTGNWKQSKEWNAKRSHEREAIAERVLASQFNHPGNPWFVMVQRGSEFMAYDTGALNLFGHFPIFQCGALDQMPACQANGWASPVE